MALTPDKIRYVGGLKICEKIIPWGAVWKKDYTTSGGYTYKKGTKYKADKRLIGGAKDGAPAYITIHNTGSAESRTSAETYTRATWPNQNMKDCRVHYYVDGSEAWQNLAESEQGWHAGTGGSGQGNINSIAIEIIGASATAEKNGAVLAAYLLLKYGLGTDRLKKHQDWSGKYCPKYILPHWASFVKAVKTEMARQSAPAAAESKYNTYICVKGDSWWKISRGVYGRGAKYRQLQAINPGVKSLYVGTRLNVPKK